MAVSENKQPETKPKNVRMKKGGVIQSVPKRRVDEFKRMGFEEA
jgi:hypothetical protein